MHTCMHRHNLQLKCVHLHTCIFGSMVFGWGCQITKVEKLSALDPAAGGGAINMKSMWPPLAAIFVMTYFYRAGGSWSPGPPGYATDS